MSLGDPVQFRALSEQLEGLTSAVKAQQAEIATLKMRLGGLQGQINTLRQGGSPVAPQPPPDAPANSHGSSDAAR